MSDEREGPDMANMTARPGGRIEPRERQKLRPCLGPDHEHLILSTRAERLCKAARAQVANLEAQAAAQVLIVRGAGLFHETTA